MKIAKLGRQLKNALKEHSKLQEKISKLAEAAGIAEEQNLGCEFESHWNELIEEDRALRNLIGTLTEELQLCIENGDLEKETRPDLTGPLKES
jgi:hypothetical protein